MVYLTPILLTTMEAMAVEVTGGDAHGLPTTQLMNCKKVSCPIEMRPNVARNRAPNPALWLVATSVIAELKSAAS